MCRFFFQNCTCRQPGLQAVTLERRIMRKVSLMIRSPRRWTLLILASMCLGAAAQTPLSSAGALVVVPASSEVRQANDQAYLTLMIEEQDKDKTVAASRVNLKMKQGIEIVRREDPQAVLKSRGYYTYPVYADDVPQKNQRNRQAIAWRIGQYLDVSTTNLTVLPKMVAAAQSVLVVNGLNFGLTEGATRKLDERRIAATYQNLNERVGAIARAMGRTPAEAVVETVDFDGAGASMQTADAGYAKMSMRASAGSAAVEEPSFEPGETALQMRLVAEVRFK